MSEDLRDKRSTPANNATPYHSLRSAGKEPSTPEAVADNIIKEAEVDRVEKSSNCNVERLQSMGVS
ncbi:hypothetical protein MUO79_10750 [Candidatus Bathyarchaeota archaeon]|jgi:hypothetical protein|nr:hypothetical protein [Candidatus Bathyarchaeota archaeon]